MTEHEQWKEARKYGIGGSDASCLLGANPYKTNIELWKEKALKLDAPDIMDKPYVRYGVEAEPLLRALFILDHPQYQVNYDQYKMIRHPDHPFIFATLDGELIEKETGRLGVLEIKTTNILQSKQLEKWNDRIPNNYYTQVIHQLLATGWDFVILKAQLKSQWKQEVRITTRHYTIERSEVLEDIELLLQEELKFWDSVSKQQEPALIPKRKDVYYGSQQ